MDLYVYKGPVMMFGKTIHNNWYAETRADSAAKAKSNFMYQYKQEYNLARGSKLELPGTMRLVY